MHTLLAFISLLSLAALAVFAVKAYRKTGRRRNIAFAFLAFFLSGQLFQATSDRNISNGDASTSTGTPATTSPSATTSTTTPTAPAKITGEIEADKAFEHNRAFLIEGCSHDLMTLYPKYAPSAASIAVVKPAVIQGNEIHAQIRASGIIFNCLEIKGAQDLGRPVADDPIVAKRLEKETGITAPTSTDAPPPPTPPVNTAATDPAAPSNLEHIVSNGYFGCTEEGTWRKGIQYLSDHDDAAFSSFLSEHFATGECTSFKGGEAVYLVDSSVFGGIAKLRRVGHVEEYYTNFEASK